MIRGSFLGAAAASLLLVLVGVPIESPSPATSRAPSHSTPDGRRADASYRLPPKDPALQGRLEEMLRRAPYGGTYREGRLSVAVVDLSAPEDARYAGVGDDRMRYAASLPKIAVMLAVFDQLEAGEIEDTSRLRRRLRRMIRHSDNGAASELIRTVEFETIAEVLRDPDHRLYDRDRNGGLWVGKGYGGGVGRWRRDPLHDVSHGATARQVARFLVMLERGELVSGRASEEMKTLMSRPAIEHKFVAGLREARPSARIYRKSGTWRSWHADAAIVERGDVRYAAVALARTGDGGPLLSELIVDLDALVAADGSGPVARPGPSAR